MTGYESLDELKESYQELTPEKWHDFEEEIVENQVIKRGYSDEYEKEYIHKDGTVFPVSLKVWLIEDDDKPMGMWGIVRDITERKEAEEKEEILHSLLRHDVRNKLQVIRGYFELLDDTELSDEQEKFLNKAFKATEEGSEIIEKVKHLRKAQEEEIKEVRLDSTVHKAVDQVRPTAEEQGIEIEADCPGKGCEVLGGSLLDRMFSNIIENAIQHSEGSKIRIHGEIGEDEIVCIIEDDGKGIPDRKKDKIFDQGYTTDKKRGTGLGMFLVKTLLDIYGGSIEVKDSELGGARFDVRLRKV
ncbi:hypothetical protein AKJ51_03390 [candidate division MSBL1 archaeon SCGC-AAA382A20]|uniref:Histidine kinase domain-containing protein n=1 Tax=candidate division MSBL1 archaeon SCGC-AAA382A20 TaxID=1698280 RepID=A0A133VJK1_9EURY|nr:hypothetical protein AKJ51_03390 [candidate division MSBL1 archaeon SCGC-AAA382A20]